MRMYQAAVRKARHKGGGKRAHQDAKLKAAIKAAVEELVAEGLVEKRDDTVILTAKATEAISQ